MPKTSFSLDISVKDFFFDRTVVQNSIARAEANELSKIGAFIRQTARRDVLRRRKRVSEPGEAPSVHSTDRFATLRNILFAYLPQEHSVVIGPVRLNQVNLMADTGSSQTVPQILEFGGSVIIHEEQQKSSRVTRIWYRRDLRYSKRQWKRYRTRMATYAPRPFMEKALLLEVEKGTIRSVWRASISAA